MHKEKYYVLKREIFFKKTLRFHCILRNILTNVRSFHHLRCDRTTYFALFLSFKRCVVYTGFNILIIMIIVIPNWHYRMENIICIFQLISFPVTDVTQQRSSRLWSPSAAHLMSPCTASTEAAPGRLFHYVLSWL